MRRYNIATSYAIKFNLLYLESVDTETTNKNYLQSIAEKIKSKEQLIRLSQYAFHINEYFNLGENKMSFEEAMQFLTEN